MNEDNFDDSDSRNSGVGSSQVRHDTSKHINSIELSDGGSHRRSRLAQLQNFNMRHSMVNDAYNQSDNFEDSTEHVIKKNGVGEQRHVPNDFDRRDHGFHELSRIANSNRSSGRGEH